MADNTTIKWIWGLTIYIFIAVVISQNMIGAVNYFNQDSKMTTGSVNGQDFETIFSGGGQCERGSNPLTEYDECQYLGITNQETCQVVSGCTWINDTSSQSITFPNPIPTANNLFPVFFKPQVTRNISGFFCNGTINYATILGKSPVTTNDKYTFYENINVINNRKLCTIFGHSWVTFDELSSSASVTTVWKTLKFLMGFRIEGNVPQQIGFIWSFMFFWLEVMSLIMLIIIWARG